MPQLIRIHPDDNVAVALRPVPAGTVFEGVMAQTQIPQGHKMALKPLAENDQVMKYGFSIGHAVAAIQPGDWVHTHNMATNLTGEENYTYQPNIRFPEPVTPRSVWNCLPSRTPRVKALIASGWEPLGR